MSNEKMENLLNLALDATEREREKSLDLDTGYDRAERTWEVIVKFGGTEEALRGLFAEKFPEEYDRIRITNLRNEYAILLLPEHIVELVAALTEIEYMEKPKLLFFAVNNGRRVSCINQLQTVGTEQGTLSSGRNLSGTGVIVAVIDSGIDYTHPDFRNADGTTRILNLWDQTIPADSVADPFPAENGETSFLGAPSAISNLSLAVGDFITESDDENKEKVCVLGASVAEEIFGSAIDAYGSVIYIDDRSYVVNGVLSSMGTVASGISPDDSIFIPYATGVKYLVGTNVSPTITVIAEDVSNVSGVTEEITEVLATSYPNAEFTFEDAGSKMEAASASNEILTMLLMAMAAIVFVVGGIGIMNVLFVSVKERTNEIGILKAIGCSQRNILFEFLAEAAAISLIGGVLGIVASLLVTPVAQYLGVRVELTPAAFLIALLFALITGTLFGFYPAYKASKLVPVEALGAE